MVGTLPLRALNIIICSQDILIFFDIVAAWHVRIDYFNIVAWCSAFLDKLKTQQYAHENDEEVCQFLKIIDYFRVPSEKIQSAILNQLYLKIFQYCTTYLKSLGLQYTI